MVEKLARWSFLGNKNAVLFLEWLDSFADGVSRAMRDGLYTDLFPKTV